MLAVVGVHASHEVVDGAGELAGLHAEEAVQLVRPAHAARLDVPSPHPEPGNPLGLAHARGVVAQLLLGPLQLGDVAEQHDEVVADRERAHLEAGLERLVVLGGAHRPSLAAGLLVVAVGRPPHRLG
ncbi:MAG: hypothetical protein M3153_05300, partial [Chloroflexota bacterium]|nr:hypothetical protein [Chloroflexota bacterium]